MSLSKKNKLTYQHTKKQIRLITKEIEQKAIGKINSALTCGALSEDSDFHENNQLLARTILEDVMVEYEIKFPPYQKEAKNLRNCL